MVLGKTLDDLLVVLGKTLDDLLVVLGKKIDDFLVVVAVLVVPPTAESFGVSAQMGSGVRGGPEVRFHEGSTIPPGFHQGSTRVLFWDRSQGRGDGRAQ